MSKNIKIYFSKTKDYKVIPVTGVWGGVAPGGDIFFDLFIDRKDNPEYIELKINDQNRTEEVMREGEEKIIREYQIGIILRPDNALTIGKWLIDKAKLAGASDNTEKKQWYG